MRFNPERIQALQKLLKEQTGHDYTDEEIQQAGLAIIRFVLVKERGERSNGELESDQVDA